ncbi:hypothetical protein TVAG_398820 [Trichomonas vaginalis G3]|uniref:Uncharacterized protein n=2 Tax=Trichomonas vaginalis (strain ATCC PRA-98 / G3) TaxID=412133 RepID=A2EVH1_TRIV3|nr:hypothetical protein TVAG_398820 [Trichomonas vaginalis G3]|eukprot:XP_001315580.1 hypothetical protein [Trichomonas vaginalis G3]
MGAVIRKKAKAKRAREAKLAKTKQYPKRSKKMLVAPKTMPNREEIEASIHAGSQFINEVFKPISQKVQTEKVKYSDQMDELHHQIIEQYKQRVEEAKNSYSTMLSSVDEADAFIEVLDARDPQACRYPEFENSVAEKKKPLMIVLNKCDLVPRDIVYSWIAELNKTAPTAGICALAAEPAQACISALIAQVANGASKIAVIGIPKVGKSKICELSQSLIELPSIAFAETTSDLCLLDAAVWQDPMNIFATEVVSRAVQTEGQPDIFTIYEVDAGIEDPAQFIDALCDNYKMRPKAASKKFIETLVSGTQRWFTVPPADVPPTPNPVQEAALELSIPMDLSTTKYVQFHPGDNITVNTELLNEQFAEEEEGDEEEEAKQE